MKHVHLGAKAERKIAELVARGDYPSREAVLQARAELDAMIEQGLADVEAGRVCDAEEVFAELIDRYQNWPPSEA
jgi:predicted transcriptional regulator